MRKKHNAVSVAKTTLAFWTPPGCSQVIAEVLGLQRVKHHSLRKDECRKYLHDDVAIEVTCMAPVNFVAEDGVAV